MNLQLSLKEKWFRQTKSGFKPEDYREITPYWCNRLMIFDGKQQPKRFWEPIARGFAKGSFYHRADFKLFGYNIMTLGYPKKTDFERILNIEHKGIEIRTGNPEWGAEPDKIYFVVKHGEIL